MSVYQISPWCLSSDSFSVDHGIRTLKFNITRGSMARSSRDEANSPWRIHRIRLVLVYLLTPMGYINGKCYMAAPWIRHGLMFFFKQRMVVLRKSSMEWCSNKREQIWVGGGTSRATFKFPCDQRQACEGNKLHKLYVFTIRNAPPC